MTSTLIYIQHTSPAQNLNTLRLSYQVPKINTTSAEQLHRASCYCHWPIKTLATASLPEYVATHSLRLDYLAPFRTPH